MWTREIVKERFKNPRTILVATTIFSSAVASAVTYSVTTKRLESKFAEIARLEIEEAKEFYGRLNKTGDFETPEKALAALHPEGDEALLKAAVEAVKAYGDLEEKPIDFNEVAVAGEVPEGRVEFYQTNIFVNADSQWNQEVEESKRDPLLPYIISKEEFFENEPEHDQAQYVFYEGDGVLSDEQDKDVPDTENTVGDDNLVRWGHGSGDSNLLYVRNERLALDFEISRSNGKYAHEVLGFSHSLDDVRPGVRKFRRDLE